MTKLIQIPQVNEESAEELEAAFSKAESWPMLAFGDVPSGYEAGSVRLGWHEEALVMFADLPDADIRTDAKEDFEAMWTLGDVFEIFIKREGYDPYFELHVTPNSHRLQLRFPDGKALQDARKTGKTWEDFKIFEPVFSYRVFLKPDESKWQVFARVPWASLAGNDPFSPELWRLSCSRYDFRSDLEKPVLSSTSDHKVVNYHRQSEWRLIQIG